MVYVQETMFFVIFLRNWIVLACMLILVLKLLCFVNSKLTKTYLLMIDIGIYSYDAGTCDWKLLINCFIDWLKQTLSANVNHETIWSNIRTCKFVFVELVRDMMEGVHLKKIVLSYENEQTFGLKISSQWSVMFRLIFVSMIEQVCVLYKRRTTFTLVAFCAWK